jgi:hypothetical protein
MADASLPAHVHLVGSIGLDSVEEVFRTTGRLLGDRLRRIPDGKVGGRRLWVSWQYPLLRSSPYLQPDPSGVVRKTSGFPLLCLAEGVTPDEVHFGELGYAREARASYLDFCAARDAGQLPPGVRFQVCLPTPMGLIYAFCTARDVLAIEPAYERAMIAEVAALCRTIPHRDLCIQWDVWHEMLMLDGRPQDQFPMLAASFDEVMARMTRLSADVPDDVELGFHLCYGDFGAKHIMEPVDSARLVEMANGVTQAVGHKIAFIHMPVPVERTDDSYFRPLRDLALAPDTELYLGLLHLGDGADGLHKRLTVARRYVDDFGVGTECGFARARKADLVTQILEMHRDATQPQSR